MAGSKVGIVNLALARLGEHPIQGLDEGTVAANTAALLFNSTRQATLRDFNWGFAMRTATLARESALPADGGYAYALPSLCLRAVRLLSGDSFFIRGNSLITSAPSATLEYISDIDDVAMFDSKFVEAFSYKLASELAMSVKGSAELMSSYLNAYQNFIRQAATESTGERHDTLPDNPYVDARF